AEFCAQTAEFILSKGSRLYFADESRLLAKYLAKSLKRGKGNIFIVPKHDLVDHCDLIVVLGGDGTFLSIARLMKNRSIPVMGINMGQLGFLTEIKRSEAKQALDALLGGKTPVISDRALLEVTLTRGNKRVFQG